MAEIRLAKITKQYSIALGKLVGFLNGIGANVELNPNVKISDEYLPAIEEKFGEERKLKEAADVVTIKLKEIISKGSKNSVHDERIFISYSRKDKDLVLSIVDHIQKAVGVKCWIDEKGIESGEQFKDVIMAAIDKCEIVIFMMSENSLKSSFTKKEVNYADHMKKRIVPVILDGDELRGWFVFDFAGADYIIASNPEHVAKLIRNLKSWLGTDNICYEPHEMEHFSLSNATVSSLHPTNEVNLKVLTNLNCKVLIDCEEKGIAQADHLTKIPLPIGEYYAEFVSTENSADALSREIILEHDKLEKVDLLSLKQAREKSEAEQEKARLEQERISRIESMTLVPYISNNKVGFADLQTSEVIIPCQYDFVSLFSEGLASVKMNKKWGFIDKFGRQVVQFKYDDYFSSTDYFKYFHDGLAVVRLNGRYGCVDKYGREVVPCRYGRCDGVSEGMACVTLEIWNRCKWGYVDKSGREVTSFIYDIACDFHDGLACVMVNGKWGFVDKSGCEVIPCKYEPGDSVIGLTDLCIDSDFHEGLARVKFNGKYGFIDKSGKDVISCKYDIVCNFSDGLARVNMRGKWGYVDKFGKELISCRYTNCSCFSEGLACVELNYQKGYIDKSGKEVIPCKYEYAFDFHEGLARVVMNDRWGYLDKLGREVIPFIYQSAKDFSDGVAEVVLNGKRGYIDLAGCEVIPCIYDDASDFYEGMARVESKGQYGFIDKSCKEIIPCKYDACSNFCGGLASVTLNGKHGYIDRFGNEMWPEE